MLAYHLEHQGHSWSDVEQVFILNDKHKFWYALNRDIYDDIVNKYLR